MADPEPQPESQPVAPAPTRAERRAQSWQETKTDLKWATALLFVLIVAVSGYLWAKWTPAPAGAEDLNAMTDGIFDVNGSLVVPFEVLSVLLLAALIAGVVVALREKEDD